MMGQIEGPLTIRHLMLDLQDTSATCHNLYQVLPLAVCVDAASTPARYEPCDPACPANSTGNHFEPGPWGPISAQCNSTQQTRTGGLTKSSKSVLLHCNLLKASVRALPWPLLRNRAQLGAESYLVYVIHLEAGAYVMQL